MSFSMNNLNESFNDNERLTKPESLKELIAKDPFYVDKTADWLVSELGATNSREYFCKVANHIRRPYLDNLVTIAKEKGKDPTKLFVHMTEQTLRKFGVPKSEKK